MLIYESRYLDHYSEEIAQLKRERRPGRPSTSREDQVKRSIVTEGGEYEAGYWLPDLRDVKNVEALREWSGQWSALNTLKFIRLSRDGSIRESSFPPKGLS